MKTKIYRKLASRQQGAALLVALVILVVVTLIGAASMKSSTMELKMANSQKDRDSAFAAAEAGLTAAEEWLELNTPKPSSLRSDCGGGTHCYNATCNNGLCFDGNYTEHNKFRCEVGDSTGSIERKDFWSDTSLNVWGQAGKHRFASVEGMDANVKYIVEFLCYVPPNKDPGTVFTDLSPFDGKPLFRITALAEGNNDRAQVMLQSTYMLVE